MDTDVDLPYRQDISACLDTAPAAGPQRLSLRAFEDLLTALQGPLLGVRRAWESDAWPFLRLPEARDDLRHLEPIAARYRARFPDVVVLGTGGSSLGGKALYQMSRPKSRRAHDGPVLHIAANIDPFNFDALFARLDPARVGVVAVSKSGATVETLMQLLSILPQFRSRVGDAALRDHILLVTAPGDTPLRRLGQRFGLPILDHHPDIGGRYSVLSVVGMLPAMIAGLDAIAIRSGAEEVLRQALTAPHPRACAAAVGAAAAVGLCRNRGTASAVMLAYSDQLGSLARWHRQLWAESLGKNGQGTTPIYGVGPVDQHSQLQLWLDGPPDKMFTILGSDASGGAPIGADLTDADPALAFMAGKTLGMLMAASQRTTTESLIRAGRPVRLMQLERIDEAAMGALMMHFMLETVLAAALLNVNPFDQPAVEEGKILTRRYMRDSCPS